MSVASDQSPLAQPCCGLHGPSHMPLLVWVVSACHRRVTGTARQHGNRCIQSLESCQAFWCLGSMAAEAVYIADRPVPVQYGRKNLADITREVEGKTEEEVRQYSETFWARGEGQLAEWERVSKNIGARHFFSAPLLGRSRHPFSITSAPACRFARQGAECCNDEVGRCWWANSLFGVPPAWSSGATLSRVSLWLCREGRAPHQAAARHHEQHCGQAGALPQPLAGAQAAVRRQQGQGLHRCAPQPFHA